MTAAGRHGTVQQRTSVHEKTIQAFASGDLAPTPKARRKGAHKAAEVIASWGFTTHPEVMVEVERILMSPHGYTKVEYLDPETVIIR
jgi:hypothetical protein